MSSDAVPLRMRGLRQTVIHRKVLNHLNLAFKVPRHCHDPTSCQHGLVNPAMDP